MSFKQASSFYVGYTSRSVPYPVMYSPHTAVFNNEPPITAVTGKPGSGKTFACLNIAAQSVATGVNTIVIDPKGDFLPLLSLQGELGKVHVWDLGGDGNEGVLDPFNLVDTPGEGLSLAITVIDLFIGGLNDDETTVLSPIIKDVLRRKKPSLKEVVSQLRSSPKALARQLGTKLDLVASTNFAKVAFAPASKVEKVNFNSGLTLIPILGLNLPETPEDAKETIEGRLATGLLYLLTYYIVKVLKSSKATNPKLLIIDEAWSVISTPQGKKVIKSLALLGRSKAFSTVLALQNYSHLAPLNIESTISTRFSFKNSEEEAALICEKSGLPMGEGYETIIPNLGKGECLMQDWRGRNAIVQFDAWNKEWLEKFDSNSLKALQRAKAEQQAEEETI